MRVGYSRSLERSIFLDSSFSTEFHTLKGYQMHSESDLTEAMEDYLEMIGRCMQENGYVRVNALANKLHVRPSSVSKMVNKLRELDLVQFEKYGLITTTEKGYDEAQYLLWRHEVLLRFFRRLNGEDDQLTLVEQVEHFLDKRTVENLDRLLRKLETNFIE